MAATFNRRADVYQGETGAKGGETLFRGKRENLVVTYQLYFLCRVGGVVQLLFVCFLFWKDGCYLSLHPGSSLQLSAAGNISRQESSKGSLLQSDGQHIHHRPRLLLRELDWNQVHLLKYQHTPM